jgi:hypothetical protein
MKIVVHIYESEPYPVVTHIFNGRTYDEAYSYLKAHMQTDEFMRDAIMKREWNGIPLRVEMESYGNWEV